MDIYKLKELSQEDRQLVFQSEAIGCEELAYTKQLTPEEITIKKDEFTNQSMMKSTLTDELTEVKADYKGRIDPLTKSLKQTMKEIKNKSIECMGKVYKFADYENQMIHVVDPLGNLISSRRMLPEERQFVIRNVNSQAV